MRKLILTLALTAGMTVMAAEHQISSPDGNIVVTVSDQGGLLTYSATLQGRQLLLPSRMGLKTDFADLTQQLSITAAKESNHSGNYTLRQVKQRDITFDGRLLTLDVQNQKRQRMQVLLYVSNRDVAYKYIIPRQERNNPKCAVITEEASAFRLPDNTTTFLCPQIGPGTGWELTKPSYEEEYTPDAPLNARSQYGQGYTFPCLFRVPGPEPEAAAKKKGAKAQDCWLLISETGVSSQYCGAHLSDYSPERGYQIAFPHPGENKGHGMAQPGIELPGETPWRTITLGNSLAPIVETTVSYDLVQQQYEPSQNYQGGRYTWSWIIWQDNSINYDDQVRFIDTAAEMNYEFCLVDGCWDETIGRGRMAELSRYAQSKGVRLLLWYNSNGYWNNAPQTPRNRMNTAIAREAEMRWMQSIGVAGIKVDFFGGDKQMTMQLYEDILSDANRYGLQVIFHGCTLPRGWEKMYPNFVSSEAVLASENVYFTDHHARREPFELTMHPFCRNTVATMDWGGVFLNKFMSKDNRSRHPRYTTDAFEVATAVMNQAYVQCVALQPNNLLPEEQLQLPLNYLKRLPWQWRETRYVDGYPGRYAVVARRAIPALRDSRGNTVDADGAWYVAGLNGTDEPMTLTLSLPGVTARQQVELFGDKPVKAQKKAKANKKVGQTNGQTDSDKLVTNYEAQLSTLTADKRGLVTVTMQPRGGFVIKY